MTMMMSFAKTARKGRWKMRRLKFAKGLLRPVISGDKKITLRRYKAEAHDFNVGDVILGIFEDGLSIPLLVTKDTVAKRFSELTEDEAIEDGFSDSQSAFEGVRKHYPHTAMFWLDYMAVIRFEVLKVEGIPVISYNSYDEGEKVR